MNRQSARSHQAARNTNNTNGNLNSNNSESEPRTLSPAAAILALLPRQGQPQNQFDFLSVEDIDFDDEFLSNSIPEFPEIESSPSTSISEESATSSLRLFQGKSHSVKITPRGRVVVAAAATANASAGWTRGRNRSRKRKPHFSISISRSRPRGRNSTQAQNESSNALRTSRYRLRNCNDLHPTNNAHTHSNSQSNCNRNPVPSPNDILLPVDSNSNVGTMPAPNFMAASRQGQTQQNQNQRPRPFRVSNIVDNEGAGLGQGQGQGQGQGEQGQGQVAIPNENNDDSFTWLEHIGMVGARNFFVPSVRRASLSCINCYKRTGFYISMLLTLSCVFFFWNSLLHPFRMIGREFFTAQRFQRMFLTDNDFYPLGAMLVIYFTMILSAKALHYTNRPEYDFGFLPYLNSVRCILVFSGAILVWHIYAHAKYYPDDQYEMELKGFMIDTLARARNNIENGFRVGRPLPIENKMWDDTHFVFKCCGLHDYRDWIPNNTSVKLGIGIGYLSSVANFVKYVPKSCCSDASLEVCEVALVYKAGCFDAQMKELVTESIWVINPGLFLAFFGHLALYIVLGKLFSNTVARNRTGRPFVQPPPPPPAQPNPPRHHYPI